MKEEALKLADYVDAREINNPHLKEASAMIRRLVEELDRNKIYIQKMEDALGCDVSYYEPLNKPVNPFAWVDSIGTFVTNSDYKELPERLKEDMIPLYTSPHHDSDVKQTKPLSFDVMVELGKEVDAVWDVNINGSVWFPSVDAFESFCRAIEERHGIK